MLRTIYLLVAYDGTDFHGWQNQPGQRTVQSVLEHSLRRVVRHEVEVIGCGRTDAGVHAAGHVASFATTSEIPVDRLRQAIGSRLPEDTAIIDVRHVAPTFSARSSAISKLYRYRIHNARGRAVERRAQRYTYHFWHALDLERMREAARYFVGEKDFTAMTPKRTVRETMVRRVLRCDIERHDLEVRIDVEGTGFLYNQVRNMVGTLVEVGRAQWTPGHVEKILESRNRSNAGPTAPARGLCLQWVRYPASLLRPTGDAAPRDRANLAGEPLRGAPPL